MKVLLSAFSCKPWHGSEPEVGFRTMLAAAEKHEVWVLTSDTGMPALDRFLADHPWRTRIHLVPHPAVPPGKNATNLGLVRFHRMYDRWQHRIAPIARDLDRTVNFDVVHHVTIATVWTRTGVAAVDKPLVWGPVGGGVRPPLSLAAELGWRGAAEDLTRVVARTILSRLPHAQAARRRATVAFAQNSLTARVMRTSAPITVLSNGTAADVTHITLPSRRTADLMFVGRLVPWKGTMLALRALRALDHPDARLRFYGKGPDRNRLERVATRWGIRERVQFEGFTERDAMLADLASAAALVHPSLHDESGLAVAEALALGTPAICLDYGGPADVVRHWPHTPGHLVRPGTPRHTARRIAAVMRECLERPAPLPNKAFEPHPLFRQTVQQAYETAAAGGPRVDRGGLAPFGTPP